MTIRILIANRGEIAIRIARSIKEMGFSPLGIYTRLDKNSLHRRFMVEDAEIGSYLDIDEIIEAAEELGADAIHPGYGFLSENVEFAKRVVERGFIFIGPSPETMALAGDKVKAKKVAFKVGVPTLPWRIAENIDDVREFAEEHGYPLMLKAVGGGGGMGIRIIHNEEELDKLYEQARKEAENAFKDPRLYVEPYLEGPKHIEVQILGDGERAIHLYERDCSVQRRHQKIIEEAPAVILSPEERKKITGDAVKLMKTIKYMGAGTVEMLYDMKRKQHYFMEINARLQVEHPVTEMITGIDIVKQQIIIALEERLRLKQRDVKIMGHAIEARINAENPVTLMPSPGTIKQYIEPSGPGVRVDSGVVAGSTVSSEYNPLIAKLIVMGRDRREAILRLNRALDEYIITGIQTNIPLIKSIIKHPVFLKALHTTNFLDKHMDDIIMSIKKREILHAAILVASAYKGGTKLRSRIVSSSRYAPYTDGLEPARLESLKRRAWIYWTLLRTRVRKRSVGKSRRRK